MIFMVRTPSTKIVGDIIESQNRYYKFDPNSYNYASVSSQHSSTHTNEYLGVCFVRTPNSILLVYLGVQYPSQYVAISYLGDYIPDWPAWTYGVLSELHHAIHLGLTQ